MRQGWWGVVLLLCTVVWRPDVLWAQGEGVPPPKTPQAADRISLDLKGVDILDVLKLLSQRTDLNFVAGRNVTGRVTIFVSDVDVWEAFERIIGANDLAYEQHGEIVTVMAARDYELIYGEKFQERKERAVLSLQYAKAVQVATALNQLKSAVGQVVVDETSNTIILNDVPSRLAEMREVLKKLDRPTRTRVYRLDYASVEELQEKVQNFLSTIGTITVDARTNTAVITDLNTVLLQVDRLIEAFDIAEKDVLIEAKIVKVDLTDTMETGIDWDEVFGGLDSTVAATFDKVLGDTVTGAATGLGIRYSPSATEATLILEILQTITDTETIASPRIRVSNGQEAKILVGKKEAFVTTTTTIPATGSTVTAPTIEFVDVGTKLFVTPQIKAAGYISLHIRPEVSSAEIKEFQDNRIPIVTSTEAETTVLVKSGSTVIIGGLIETTTTFSSSQVPVLGDIPFIGALFRGTSDIKERTELVVFLTPQIVLPDGTMYTFPDEQVAKVSVPTGLPEIVLKEPVSVAYRHQVRERLQDALITQFRSTALEHGSVTVSFVLNHDGRMVGEPSITSPQGIPFIVAATQAVQRAQPFPAFPEGSGASEVRFRLAVEYAP